MQVIDPEDILKQVAAIKERTKDALSKSGQDGVNARLEHEIGSALFAWRAGEANRQTAPAEVTEALTALAVSHLGAHMFENVLPDHYVGFAIEVAQDLLHHLIALATSSAEHRERLSQTLRSKEMGVA